MNHTIIFNEGLSYVDICKCYTYSYETINSIAIAFEGNGQLVPKHRGVRYIRFYNMKLTFKYI